MPRRVVLFNGDKNDGSGVARQDEVKAPREDSPEKLISLITSREGTGNKLAMAVEFDHMYIGCSDSKASIGKDIEVQHLKNLLILHLDLIQQQAQQLAAKDKQINTLQDENENLRAKLERMDRRVSLSQQKRPSEAATNTEHERESLVEAAVAKVDESVSTEDDIEPPTNILELSLDKPVLSPKPISNKLAALSIKTLSPTNILGSPTRVVTFSSKSVSPCSSAAVSPSYKSISPCSKVGSPNSKTSSPVSKPGSPSSKTESPNTKTVECGWQITLPLPLSLPGSPVESFDIGESFLSKPSSPCKPGSPSSRPVCSKPVSPKSKTDSPPYKAGSPPCKAGSPPCKAGSPPCKAGSPYKVGSPSSKVGSPHSKPGSPTNKVASPPSKVRSPPGKPVSPSQKLGSPFNKICSTPTKTTKIEVIKRVSPKVSPRERHTRGEAAERTVSESDSYCEGSWDTARSEAMKITEKRERPILKRRSESESEVPAKRARAEDGGIIVSAGPTDHNLRSRDKPKERGKEVVVVKRSSPVPSLDRPCTPTSRAAALEAKKLRQRLMLKGQPPSGRAVRGEGILNTSLAYYLPYGVLLKDPNPEEECFQSQVEIPRWGTRVLTSLYVMEGTENLEDEVFLKRHAKPEQDEKRRKRWDLQRMREQRHYERLRERYESRQNTSEPEVSGYRSLWPNPESAHYLLVDDCIPVCAFGQPMARIPPQEFALPWLSGRGQEGISTRRRKRP